MFHEFVHAFSVRETTANVTFVLFVFQEWKAKQGKLKEKAVRGKDLYQIAAEEEGGL